MTSGTTSRGEHGTILLLWDIDRTLIYVGEVDRTAYREAFEEVELSRPAHAVAVGGSATSLRLSRVRPVGPVSD
jgi:hypothetical protein